MFVVVRFLKNCDIKDADVLSRLPMADSSRACGLLVVVLDTNPIWWGQQLLKVNREVSILVQCVYQTCSNHWSFRCFW